MVAKSTFVRKSRTNQKGKQTIRLSIKSPCCFWSPTKRPRSRTAQSPSTWTPRSSRSPPSAPSTHWPSEFKGSSVRSSTNLRVATSPPRFTRDLLWRRVCRPIDTPSSTTTRFTRSWTASRTRSEANPTSADIWSGWPLWTPRASATTRRRTISRLWVSVSPSPTASRPTPTTMRMSMVTGGLASARSMAKRELARTCSITRPKVLRPSSRTWLK